MSLNDSAKAKINMDLLSLFCLSGIKRRGITSPAFDSSLMPCISKKQKYNGQLNKNIASIANSLTLSSSTVINM